MKKGVPVAEVRRSWGIDQDRPLFVRINMFGFEEAERRRIAISWTIQLFHLRYVCRLVQVGRLGYAVLVAGHDVPEGWVGELLSGCMEGGAECPLDPWMICQSGQAFVEQYIREGWAAVRDK
jgi:hypothetical protein